MREGKWSMCRPVPIHTSQGVGPHPLSTALAVDTIDFQMLDIEK